MSKNWRFVRRCAIHFIVSSVKLGIKPEKINNDGTNMGHRCPNSRLWGTGTYGTGEIKI
jgi:hypothetical protein